MKGVYAVKRSTGTQIYISYTPKDEPRVRELFAFVDDGPEFSKRLAYAEREAAKEFVCRRAAVIEERHEERGQKQVEKPLPMLAEYVRDTYAAVLRRSDMKPEPREREIERVTRGTVGRYLGKFRLNEITRTKVEWFIDQRLGSGAGAAGINRDLARLRHLLNDAVDREELEGRLPRIAWRSCWLLRCLLRAALRRLRVWSARRKTVPVFRGPRWRWLGLPSECSPMTRDVTGSAGYPPGRFRCGSLVLDTRHSRRPSHSMPMAPWSWMRSWERRLFGWTP